MGNFIDDFIVQFGKTNPVPTQPKKGTNQKSPTLKVSLVMMPGTNPHAISAVEAALYLSQWKIYKSDYNEFLNLSKVPANYNNPGNKIYSLRESLLRYELIDSETFINKKFLESLSSLILKSKKFRILNGIKTINQIQNSSMDEDSKLAVINHLKEHCKDKIECFIIMLID